MINTPFEITVFSNGLSEESAPSCVLSDFPHFPSTPLTPSKYIFPEIGPVTTDTTTTTHVDISRFVSEGEFLVPKIGDILVANREFREKWSCILSKDTFEKSMRYLGPERFELFSKIFLWTLTDETDIYLSDIIGLIVGGPENQRLFHKSGCYLPKKETKGGQDAKHNIRIMFSNECGWCRTLPGVHTRDLKEFLVNVQEQQKDKKKSKTSHRIMFGDNSTIQIVGNQVFDGNIRNGTTIYNASLPFAILDGLHNETGYLNGIVKRLAEKPKTPKLKPKKRKKRKSKSKSSISDEDEEEDEEKDKENDDEEEESLEFDQMRQKTIEELTVLQRNQVHDMIKIGRCSQNQLFNDWVSNFKATFLSSSDPFTAVIKPKDPDQNSFENNNDLKKALLSGEINLVFCHYLGGLLIPFIPNFGGRTVKLSMQCSSAKSQPSYQNKDEKSQSSTRTFVSKSQYATEFSGYHVTYIVKITDLKTMMETRIEFCEKWHLMAFLVLLSGLPAGFVLTDSFHSKIYAPAGQNNKGENNLIFKIAFCIPGFDQPISLYELLSFIAAYKPNDFANQLKRNGFSNSETDKAPEFKIPAVPKKHKPNTTRSQNSKTTPKTSITLNERNLVPYHPNARNPKQISDASHEISSFTMPPSPDFYKTTSTPQRSTPERYLSYTPQSSFRVQQSPTASPLHFNSLQQSPHSADPNSRFYSSATPPLTPNSFFATALGSNDPYSFHTPKNDSLHPDPINNDPCALDSILQQINADSQELNLELENQSKKHK